jgi:K+-transporting ATPase c subunit
VQRQFGLLGESRVNVLELNLAVNALSQKKTVPSR